MEVVTLTCWDDFEPELRKLEQVEAPAEERDATSPAVCLFRGHGDARWSLDTTLDRFFPGKLSLAEYYQLALVARPRLEAFTGMRWQIPSYDEYREWLLGGDGLTLRDYKAYDYLAYLRHHGFPSPLLDWTQSPYVAAFFAFRYLMPGAAHVAVYAYREPPAEQAQTTAKGPVIHRQGAYVTSDRRHFLQQSQYTFCTAVDDDGVLYYTGHEGVVERNATGLHPMRKYLIPVRERRTALLQLNRMNINAFSLFGSEDSLVETIAIADIYIHGRDLHPGFGSDTHAAGNAR